jgi:hypothetical protein
LLLLFLFFGLSAGGGPFESSKCLYSSKDLPIFDDKKGDWSSGMIPALGAGGREFDSRITPLFCLSAQQHGGEEKVKIQVLEKKKKESPMRGSNPRLAG